MANEEHLKILKSGFEVWNNWRKEHPEIRPDFSNAKFDNIDLRNANLMDASFQNADISNADFRGTYLRGAILTGARILDAQLRSANLIGTNLFKADLSRANLRNANLSGANLSRTNLTGANLRDADLRGTNLNGTELYETDFEKTILGDTIFTNVNLNKSKRLETCRHRGPSSLDHRTILKSGNLPDKFLQGCGLPDELIDYYLAILNQPIRFYSCFISYNARNEDFARRIHADLQDGGIRCWFAPEDIKIGDRIRDRIDESIYVFDKLLLILSEASINSQWVEQEVESALEREREQNNIILFPIRLDNAVMKIKSGWAKYIRNSRHIGNFTNWKDHDAYKKSLERLINDLSIS